MSFSKYGRARLTSFHLFVFLLFLFHLLSGAINARYGLQIGGFSLIGVFNWLVIGFFFMSMGLPAFRRSISSAPVGYPVLVLVLLLACIPSSVFNPGTRSLFALLGKTMSLISIYYLTYVAWNQLRKPEDTFLFLMRALFLLVGISGLINAIGIGFSYSSARELNEQSEYFSFFIFEYPHSAGIFCSILVPIYIKLLLERNGFQIEVLLIAVLVPMAFLFSGARVAFLTYMLAISISLFYVYARNITGIFFVSVLIVLMIFIAFSSEFFESLIQVTETSFDEYLRNTDSYSINSVHTRVKVWSAMWFYLKDTDTFLWGNGFRSWDQIFRIRWGLGSSQSDYFTALFETGVVGLTGLLLYKFCALIILLRRDLSGSALAIFTLIGLFSGSAVGGFTENVEGYASTVWLCPVLLSFIAVVDHRGRAKKISTSLPREL